MRLLHATEPPPRRQPTWLSARSCVVALCLAALAGCGAERRHPNPAAVVRSDPVAASRMPMDAAQWLRRHAVQALLVPLLDVDEPSRWAVRTAEDPCLEGGWVRVDGQELDGGTALPDAFTVERRFDACPLFGDDRLELTGTVVLTVTVGREHALEAVVDARHLHVRAPDGRDAVVEEVFVASAGPDGRTRVDGQRGSVAAAGAARPLRPAST